MKYRTLFTVVLCACFSTCLIVFPSGGTQGAIRGLELCYSVIIPSLFPFSVCALMLFESNALTKASDFIAKTGLKINFQAISVFIISCIGGYPVGAKLIEKSYVNKQISKHNAELMLGYCVNSGPSFILIAVGAGILGSYKLGLVLFSANLLACIILALILSCFIKPQKKTKQTKISDVPFSDMFVTATYDATQAMISICAFVVLFSSALGLIDTVIPNSLFKKTVTSLLEVTSGIAYSDKNIYTISFLLGFSGFCVHFQVLAMCKTLKPSYLKFLSLRMAHGALSVLLTHAIIKVFKISLPAISANRDFTLAVSEYSTAFSIALLALSVAFMVSLRKSCKTI